MARPLLAFAAVSWQPLGVGGSLRPFLEAGDMAVANVKTDYIYIKITLTPHPLSPEQFLKIRDPMLLSGIIILKSNTQFCTVEYIFL